MYTNKNKPFQFSIIYLFVFSHRLLLHVRLWHSIGKDMNFRLVLIPFCNLFIAIVIN
jgi:hypothetical protein